ncbi:MAG: SRPBCC family protein [Microbacteriaceae bacterium]
MGDDVSETVTEKTTMVGPPRYADEFKMTLEDIQVPVTRYISDDFRDREFARLWPRVWQVACRADEVASPGDYYEYRIGDQSILIVRAQDGKLNAFHNVCPHRANLIRTGTGNTGTQLVCGFHKWSFELDGTLKKISDRETFCPLDESQYNLRPALVDSWAGWVFVRPDPTDAEPLLEFLSPLPELLAAYHLEHLVPTGLNLTTTVSCNWKVGIESFLETYHIHAIHPQLLPNGDDQRVLFENWERHNKQLRPFGIPSPRLGPPGAVDPDETLEALFGPRKQRVAAAAPVDRLAEATVGGSGDYFSTVVHDVGDPWEMFDQYRDEDGAITLPEGVTIRSVMEQYYRRASALKGVDFSGLSPDQFVDNWNLLLFPNVILNVNVGSVLAFRFMPDSQDVHSSRWDLITYDWVLDGERAAQVRAPHREIPEQSESLGLLMDQDMFQMPRVQRGMRSGALHHVTLSSQENRIIHFNEVIDRYLAD